MTAWPSGLSLPRASGATRQPVKSGARFEVDAGPAKQRPTTTTALERLDLVYPCTAAQRDTLLEFYFGDAGRGGVWFDYTNPFTKVAGQARFIVGQEPKETPNPPKFEVSLALEFMS